MRTMKAAADMEVMQLIMMRVLKRMRIVMQGLGICMVGLKVMAGMGVMGGMWEGIGGSGGR